MTRPPTRRSHTAVDVAQLTDGGSHRTVSARASSANIRGRFVHRQLTAASDLSAPTSLQHVSVDAVGRRHVLVSDLVGHYSWSAPAGEERRDARIAQRVRADLSQDRGDPGLLAPPVGFFEGRRNHVLRDGVARPALAPRVQECRRAGLPCFAARGLVRGELFLKIVMDVHSAHARRRLRVEHAQFASREVDVLAVERAELADPKARERERRDHGAVARHGSLVGAAGVVDRGGFGDAELGADCPPCLARRAHPDYPAAQLVVRCGALIQLACGVDERHRLVELEAVLLLASDLEPQVLAFGGVACEQSLAHAAREDLREQVQVRVDRLRAQRLHRAPAPIDERLADRQCGLDPAVLCELPVEVGLDVAARQLADGDVAEVRQQMNFELALHVGQAVGAQALPDFALVVLVGKLSDGWDFRFRRSPPSAAGSRCRRGSGWRSAVPRARHVHDSRPRRCAREGSSGTGSHARGSARCSSRRRCGG